MLPLQGTTGAASPDIVAVVAVTLAAVALAAVLIRFLRGRRGAND
jgi:hypothetical protein